MKDLLKKAAIFGTSAALLGVSALPALGATVLIDGNGSNSTSNATITDVVDETTDQRHTTNDTILAEANAQTGENEADQNTGGNVTVASGYAVGDTWVDSEGGINEVINSCDCAEGSNDTITISANGESTNNTGRLVRRRTRNRTQRTTRDRLINAIARAFTRRNRASNNTNGTVDVTSGNATANTTVNATGDVNSDILGDIGL